MLENLKIPEIKDVYISHLLKKKNRKRNLRRLNFELKKKTEIYEHNSEDWRDSVWSANRLQRQQEEMHWAERTWVTWNTGDVGQRMSQNAEEMNIQEARMMRLAWVLKTLFDQRRLLTQKHKKMGWKDQKRGAFCGFSWRLRAAAVIMKWPFINTSRNFPQWRSTPLLLLLCSRARTPQ